MLQKKGILSFGSWKLNESLSSARERFLDRGVIDQETFDQLKALDPTPTFKYLEKIIDFYIKDKPSIEELGEAISRFHTLLGKNQIKTRDINAFKGFGQLKQEVEESSTSYSKKSEFKEKVKNADVVYENDDWIVVLPKTEEASCKYGSGTRWCISAKEDNRFNQYYSIGGVTIYVILSKKLKPWNPVEETGDKDYKIAVSVYPDGKKECNDSTDKHIDFEYVLEKTGLPSSLFVKTDTELLKDEDYIKEYCKFLNCQCNFNEDGTFDIIFTGNEMNAIFGPDYDDMGFMTHEDFFARHNEENGLYIYYKARKINPIVKLKIRKFTGNIKFSGVKSLKNLRIEQVEGSFDCSGNKLNSLEGAPQEVTGDFNCEQSELLTLEGAPKRVGMGFFCKRNQLKDLVGAPQEVGENFDCFGNFLETLEGAPKKITGRFKCSANLLKNLIGSPQVVGENFDCALNPLVSLEGAPKIVGELFECTRKYLPESEIEWAKKNINAKYFRFEL